MPTVRLERRDKLAPMPVKAKFVEPMLLLRTDSLPDDPAKWRYELKLDGYRAIAFKTIYAFRLCRCALCHHDLRRNLCH